MNWKGRIKYKIMKKITEKYKRRMELTLRCGFAVCFVVQRNVGFILTNSII